MIANWKVALVASGCWLLGAVVAFATLGPERATLPALLGAFLVPVLVAVNDTIRGMNRKGASLQAPPAVDLSQGNLERLFGKDNVARAWNYRISAAPELVVRPDKFGGVPDFVGVEHWPRCKGCAEPMTFVGQIDVGPGKPVPHPTGGRMFIFLCNSDPNAGPQCETWAHGAGASRCFVQPARLPALPLGEGRAELQALAEAVRRNEKNQLGGGSLFQRISRKGSRPYLPYLTRQYTVDVLETLSVRTTAVVDAQQAAHRAALDQGQRVLAGGFPDWVQEEVRIDCSCGAPTELLLQFDAFDESINLGDAGRAYVFGCRDRHSPEAFYLEWQCS